MGPAPRAAAILCLNCAGGAGRQHSPGSRFTSVFHKVLQWGGGWGGAGDDVTLLSQVENGHPGMGNAQPIPPASPPALLSPALQPCPLTQPVCPHSPAPPGKRLGALAFGINTLVPCPTPEAPSEPDVTAGCSPASSKATRSPHTPSRTGTSAQAGEGMGQHRPTQHPPPEHSCPQPSAVSLEQSCPAGCKLCACRQMSGKHSSPFFPRPGPKLAAAFQEPLAQKQRQGFSRGFWLGGFHCFASPHPHSEAFPRPSSAVKASGMPLTRWYFHTCTSPLGHPTHPTVPSRQQERAQLCLTRAEEAPSPLQQQQGTPTPLGLQPCSLEPPQNRDPHKTPWETTLCESPGESSAPATTASPRAGTGLLLGSWSSTTGVLLYHFIINPCDRGSRCCYWALLPGWTARYSHC